MPRQRLYLCICANCGAEFYDALEDGEPTQLCPECPELIEEEEETGDEDGCL